MSNQLDQNLQQQQQIANHAALKQQAKTPTPQTANAVQFSAVLQNQQKNGSTATLLAKNPVAGANVIANAIGAKTGSAGKLSIAANANSAAGSTTTSSATSGGLTDAALSGGSSSTSAQQMLNASYQMQEMNQEFNLQYLNLQEGVQADSRQFTALSNVSKTKSDTAKNSLSNVK